MQLPESERGAWRALRQRQPLEETTRMTKTLKTVGMLPSGSGMRNELLCIAGALWARLHSWRLQRETATSLSGLNDAQLKDIGLHRSEIGTVTRDTGDRLLRYRRL
jgi:uncharacterized protein YjiS (DUF1127 family)